MVNQAGIDDHTHNADVLAKGYAQVDRKHCRSHFFDFLQTAAQSGKSLEVLDIGAGSGNDANIIAQMGHKVTAIEPSGLLDIAIRDHSHPNITYVKDTLPMLASQQDKQFDMIMSSAVWAYIEPEEREASLRRIATLLKPQGKLVITFHVSPAREYQLEISSETFKRELEAVNRTLPKHQRLQMDEEPSITADPRGRKTLDGKDLGFHVFTMSSIGHAQLQERTDKGFAATVG